MHFFFFPPPSLAGWIYGEACSKWPKDLLHYLQEALTVSVCRGCSAGSFAGSKPACVAQPLATRSRKGGVKKTPKQNTSMQNIAGIKLFALNGNALSDVPSDSVCPPPPEQFTLIIHCRGNNCSLHERVEGVWQQPLNQLREEERTHFLCSGTEQLKQNKVCPS